MKLKINRNFIVGCLMDILAIALWRFDVVLATVIATMAFVFQV
jgi:hypothetical protein